MSEMEYRKLSNCAEFRSERTTKINVKTYITTENMIKDKGGITVPDTLPELKTAPAYKPSDILLSNIRPYFKKIWYSNRFGSCSNDILVIKSNDEVNPKFLFYVLSDNNFFNYATVTSKGTKMPRGTQSAIMKYLVPKIDILKQEKIADILSAYDNLIENNNKRIKLLEQMAENLYKEWFVRFRFPGYENVEFEEKKPRAWQVGTEDKKHFAPSIFNYGELGSIGSFVRGKNITAAKMIEGDIPVISAGLQPSGYHNKANVFGANLTISASGANAGYLQYHMNDIWAADCSYYQDGATIWFVYNTLKYLQPVISNLQCGAAQPHVYPKNINKLCVLIPRKELMYKYNDFVKAYYDEIKILNQNNRLLTKQRDLLLPRLMSGKLEV